MSKTDIPYLQEVINVTSGCTKISEGCQSCYAERINLRFGHTPAYDVNCPIKTHPERLEEALRWRRPRRVGVCFTSDLFHEKVPDAFIDKVFAVMALTPQHTYMLLTKRPERMREYLNGPPYYPSCAVVRIHDEMDRALTKRVGWGAGLVPPLTWPLPNVFLGVSCENQARADERIPLLLETPAAHRWVSLEPLLEAVDLVWKGSPTSLGWLDSIDWCVIGGESGPKARPCDLGWIRDIRDQCKAAGVPCYVKQVGAKPMIAISEEGNRQWYAGAETLGWRLQDSIGSSYYRDNDGNRLGFAFRLRDRKGEDPSEWRPDLRVRELPEEVSRGKNE